MFSFVLLWLQKQLLLASCVFIYPYSSGLLQWIWGNHMLACSSPSEATLGQLYAFPSPSDVTLEDMGDPRMDGWNTLKSEQASVWQLQILFQDVLSHISCVSTGLGGIKHMSELSGLIY